MWTWSDSWSHTFNNSIMFLLQKHWKIDKTMKIITSNIKSQRQPLLTFHCNFFQSSFLSNIYVYMKILKKLGQYQNKIPSLFISKMISDNEDGIIIFPKCNSVKIHQFKSWFYLAGWKRNCFCFFLFPYRTICD